MGTDFVSARGQKSPSVSRTSTKTFITQRVGRGKNTVFFHNMGRLEKLHKNSLNGTGRGSLPFHFITFYILFHAFGVGSNSAFWRGDFVLGLPSIPLTLPKSDNWTHIAPLIHAHMPVITSFFVQPRSSGLLPSSASFPLP